MFIEFIKIIIKILHQRYQILIKLLCFNNIDCCGIFNCTLRLISLYKYIIGVHLFDELHFLNICPPRESSLHTINSTFISYVPSYSLVKKFSLQAINWIIVYVAFSLFKLVPIT